MFYLREVTQTVAVGIKGCVPTASSDKIWPQMLLIDLSTALSLKATKNCKYLYMVTEVIIGSAMTNILCDPG